MAFEFRAPSGPNIGLIAQLIQAPAQARAEAAVRAGQAWGGAAQQIGQTVAALPQQIQQQHRQQTLDSMNDLKLSEMQRDVSGQRAVAGMMAGDQLPAGAAGPRQESFLDENGLFDIKKITATLGAAGYGDKASDLVSGAEKINDSILKHQQLEQQMGSAQALMFGDMADGALKLAKSGTPIPQAMDFVVQPALATHRIDPKQYAQLRDQMAQLPPDQQAAALTSLMDQAAKLDKGEILPEGAIKADRYGRTMASGAPKPPSEPELALQASGGDPAKAMDRLKPAPQPTPGAAEARYLGLQTKAEQGQALSPDESAFVRAYEKNEKLRTDATASAAADRQAKAIEQQNAIQAKAQAFNVASKARDELVKNEGAYNTAKSATDLLLNTVDDAAKGNKIAASLQSLQTTMGTLKAEGFNRINTAEIGATADAGSLFDRIAGWLGKATAGEPVPADIQKDMKEYAGLLQKSAYKKYADQFDSVAKYYDFNDQQKSLKIPTPSGGQATAAPPAMIEAIDDKGGLHHAPAGTPLPAGWKLK